MCPFVSKQPVPRVACSQASRMPSDPVSDMPGSADHFCVALKSPVNVRFAVV